jgi:hypothetical protein
MGSAKRANKCAHCFVLLVWKERNSGRYEYAPNMRRARQKKSTSLPTIYIQHSIGHAFSSSDSNEYFEFGKPFRPDLRCTKN